MTIFKRLNNWLRSPGKTFGTGMPTRRTIPDPVLVSPKSPPTSFGCELKKRSHNKMRTKMQQASRKRNR